RIGATHSVVFGGFSAEALRDRMVDAGAVCVITADGGFRRGKVVPLKQAVDAALLGAPTVKSVLVVRRTNTDIALVPGRDHLWHELVGRQSATSEPVAVDAEHPL